MRLKSSAVLSLAIVLTALFLAFPGGATSQNASNGESAAAPKDGEKEKLPDLAQVVIQAAQTQTL